MGVKIQLFVDENKIHRPNQFVQGVLQITNDGKKPEKIDDLEVQFIGQESVEWKSRKCAPCFCCWITGFAFRCTKTTKYSKAVNFIHEGVTFLERDYVPLGVSSFPFEFHLPVGSPASFATGKETKEGNGQVLYAITAKARMSSAFKSDSKDLKNVNVEGDLDLGTILPELVNQGAILERVDKKGTLRVSLEIPRQAFVIGETVPFKLTLLVDEGYKGKLKAATVALTKTVFFECGNKGSKKSIVYLDRKVCNIQKGEAVVQNFLQIPKGTEPTNLGGSLFIKIQYWLEVSALKWDDLIIPITLGTRYSKTPSDNAQFGDTRSMRDSDGGTSNLAYHYD